MYRPFFTLLFYLLSYAGICSTDKGNTTITGKLKGLEGKNITLHYQEYTLLSAQEKQDVEIAADGSFRIDIHIKSPARAFLTLGSRPVEELFTITKGDGKDTTISTQTNRSELIYLYITPKNKQNVEAIAGAIQQTLQITGKNADDSRYLNEEDWKFNRYQDKHLKNYFAYVNYTPAQYSDYVEKRQAERSYYLDTFNKTHRLAKHLKHVVEWTIYTDGIMARLLYPSMRNMYRKDNYKPDTTYYRFLPGVKVDETTFEKGIGYFYFLDYFLKESYKMSNSKLDYFDFVAEKIKKRPLYEYYAFALKANFKKKLYEKFNAQCPYKDLAKLVKSKYQHLEGMLEGNPAPLVTLQDTSGNTYSFESFKGKYIYIDFWATWCGPCIQEIPSLKAIEQSYNNKNIAFVSISMDREQDREKWMSFVREEGLSGNQLWLDGENNKKISKALNILQIPRFIVLDTNGNIVDVNAPRPSDKRLTELLDKILIKD